MAGDVSSEKMKEILSLLQLEIDDPRIHLDFRRPIDEKWWSRDHGPSIARATSESAFSTIARNFAKKIEIAMQRDEA